MIRITKNLSEKLTEILTQNGLSIRYEKGTFKGGYCILDEQKIIVINKFYPIESRINILIEVLRQIDIDPSTLNPEQEKLLHQIKQLELKL
ncbi:MAG: hypothetical protein LC115_03745 [Bacteroidia bacterium]|nr:hypothetical protein [Bacteroidia bacterium]